MQIRELKVPGAFELTPRIFPDARGLFLECYRAEPLEEALGFRLDLTQVNHSISTRGTVRGTHYALVPPGQAKYVYCPTGAFLDIIVDIRVGSPTFGVVDSVLLEGEHRRGIYIPEGVGHTVVALQDDSSLIYLCSTGYNPEREKGINPLDPALDLPIPDDVPMVLSDKDRAAPTLQQAQELGILPTWQECQQWYDALRARHTSR